MRSGDNNPAAPSPAANLTPGAFNPQTGRYNPVRSDYCSKPTRGKLNPETNAYSARVCGKCRKCKKRQKQSESEFNVSLMTTGRPPKGTESRAARAAVRCTAVDGNYDCRCLKCEEFREKLDADQRELEALRTGFLARLKDVYPGHSDSVRIEDPLLCAQNRPDLVFLPITSTGQVLTKLKAEQNDHPKSQDWRSAPSGTMDLYVRLMDMGRQALSSGAPEAAVKIANRDEVDAQLQWLTRGNGAPLVHLRADGYVVLLRDGIGEQQSAYPGCPDGVNPKAGKTFGPVLRNLVTWLRGTDFGARITHRNIAVVINSEEFRRDFHLEEYRYVSVSAVNEAHRECRKQGLVKIESSAVVYREGHQWKMETPAVYRSMVRHMPDQAAEIDGYIQRALSGARQEERQRKLLAA